MENVEFAVLKLDDKEKRIPRYHYVAVHNSKLVFDRQFPLFGGAISNHIEELEQTERRNANKNNIPHRAERPKDKYNLVQFETLASIAKIFKTKSITFDPLGGSFIIYTLRHDTDPRSLPFIPINPLLPEIKLLIFQIDRDGKMKLLTSPSDDGNEVFSNQDISKKFFFVDDMIFESELTDKSKYTELPVDIYENQKFIYGHYKGFKKPIDNGFIQQILGLTRKSKPSLYIDDKIDTVYKIIVENPDGSVKLNSDTIHLLVNEKQHDILRSKLHNIRPKMRKSITYSIEDIEPLIEVDLFELIEFIVYNFTYYNIRDISALLNSNIYVIDLLYGPTQINDNSMSFKIFKFLTDKIQLNRDDAYEVSLRIAHTGKINLFDYFIGKYDIQPTREHLEEAETRIDNESFITYLNQKYGVR